ncbi:protein of unknown function [Pseudodesulfovibrio profundus]|uniref:Uncharacterized protein n=1 Tax=Pseudodesulfovibrio profundus TaxID=57320 RepID=A0A2C8FDI0_9BACT|nr:protein of unknown function [Pseudodesulfovibrio profundus]
MQRPCEKGRSAACFTIRLGFSLDGGKVQRKGLYFGLIVLTGKSEFNEWEIPKFPILQNARRNEINLNTVQVINH